jgi:hypothetical protein
MATEQIRENLVWRAQSWRPPHLRSEGISLRHEITLSHYLEQQAVHRDNTGATPKPVFNTYHRISAPWRVMLAAWLALRTRFVYFSATR